MDLDTAGRRCYRWDTDDDDDDDDDDDVDDDDDYGDDDVFFSHGIRREENHARDVQQSAERPQARDVQQAEGVLLNSFHRIMRQLPKGEKETARASLACWGSDMVSSPLKAKAAAWETATLQEPLQSRAVVVKNMRYPLVSTTVSPVSGDAHQKPAG